MIQMGLLVQMMERKIQEAVAAGHADMKKTNESEKMAKTAMNTLVWLVAECVQLNARVAVIMFKEDPVGVGRLFSGIQEMVSCFAAPSDGL